METVVWWGNLDYGLLDYLVIIDFGTIEVCRVDCEVCGRPYLGCGGEDTEDRGFDCLGL